MIIFIRFLQWIFGFIFRLPPSAAIYLMQFAGEATYQIARLTKIKKTAARDLKLLFPKANTDLLADKLLKNISYSIFEILCTPFFEQTHLEKICGIKGLENLDLALSKRKGALILSMHTGNYELIPVALTGLGYRVNTVLRATPDPIFNLLNRSRSYKGIKLINILEANMYRESLKALGENEVICLAVDTGALEGRHEIFTFLEKKVPVATGWLTLAQRSEAPVVPAFSKREGKKAVITLGEPLTVYREDREKVMSKVGLFFENFIKNHPEQWAIFLNEYETKRMIGEK